MNELSRNSRTDTWKSFFNERVRTAADDAEAAGFGNKAHYLARATEIKRGLRECFNGCIVETLVDIGCNRGFFAKDLQNFALRTIGLDIVSVAAKYCKENERYTHQIEADGLKLPLASESVDACTLLDSLTSSQHAEELVREACRTLRPGGKIFIETLRHSGWALEALRCLRATVRDVLRQPCSLTAISRSFRRSFRPSLDAIEIKRPKTHQLLRALRNAGIEQLSIRERRLYGIFPGERVILFGQKGVSGNAKNASLK